MRSYRDLIVWQQSVELVTILYVLTQKFPKEELYGLTSQLRRSAVSIPSNIAEGKSRKTKKDYIKFLNIAYSSGAELETQIEIAKRLPQTKDFDYRKISSLLFGVMKMLNSLIRKLQASKKS
ncbi:four helix bundle protein [Patescibacteria group bacterium]|nr:four helix bundle protein [Patescibacteria group bacterium]MBU2259645.1 four helix bundle protein [Patescibacteria group bacterium]